MKQSTEKKNAISPPSRLIKILAVDDSKTNLILLDLLISKIEGILCEFAQNGQEALEKLSSGNVYNLVLMDCEMPIMKGDEVIRRIRESGKEYANIPIICMSSKHEDSCVVKSKQCLECGASGFLCKPIRRPSLQLLLELFAYVGTPGDYKASVI